MIEVKENCLCGSEIPYPLCCEPFHEYKKKPSTAERLMRSRFTPYAMHNSSYLFETWVKAKRPKEINFSKEKAEWTKLEIINIKKGAEKESKGIVEFKAYYLLDNEECVMHEISQFQKHSGQWLYLDGLVNSVSKIGQTENQGRNAPCSCGSGKKFKRCCGK